MDSEETCNVCQSNNFFEENGQYWCTECNTMSQHVTAVLVDQSVYHDPDADDMEQTEDTMSEANTHTSQKLTSFELYTKILRGLALELIELGVAPEVYKVAKVLWLTYLKKCGIILNHHRLPVLPACLNERDIEILYGVHVSRRKIITGSSKKIKKTKTSRSLASKVSSYAKNKEQRKLIQQLILEDQDCAATDVSSQQVAALQSRRSSDASRYSTDYETDDEKIRDIKITRGAQKFLKKQRLKYLKRPDLKRPSLIPTISLTGSIDKKKMHVTAMDVVSILWIAMQYTSSSYLQLSDLYRLIVDGYLCLDNLERFVPEEYRTFKSFRYFVKSLTRKSFLTRCGTICQIMEITKIRTCDIRIIVRRYVAELALPEDILEFTDKICLLTHPPSSLLVPYSYRLLPEYDLTAMAIILVTLKALFGLDDNTERELSKVATTINSHPQSPRPVQFSWSSWSQYIECRASLISSVHNVTHEATYSSRLMSQRLAAESVVDQGIRSSRVVKKKLPGDSKRLKPFLLAGLKSILNGLEGEALRAPMKPPLAVKHNESYLPQWTQQILNHPYLETDRTVFQILEQDFSQTSLDYLNPIKFTALCTRLGIHSTVYKGRSAHSPAYNNVPMRFFIRPPTQQTVVAKVQVVVSDKPREVKEEIDDIDEMLAVNLRNIKGNVEAPEMVEKEHCKKRKKEKAQDKDSQDEILTLLIPRYQYWVINHTAAQNLHGTRYKYLFHHGRAISRAIGSLCPVNFVSLLNMCASIVRSQPYHLYASMCLLEQEVLGKIGAKGSKLWPREENKKAKLDEQEEL